MTDVSYRPAAELVRVGDPISYEDADEGCIHGIVDSIELDPDGDPAVAVIRCYDGTWATLDLRECLAARPPTPTRH